MPGESVVFYDGVCGFCNGAIRVVMRHDRADHFRFASLQSDFARTALAPYGKDPSALDTFYLIADHGTPRARLLERSTAAIEVLKRLDGAFGVLGTVLSWVPRALTDLGYGIVVRHRYRIFGKLDACPLPSPEQRARFIEV